MKDEGLHYPRLPALTIRSRSIIVGYCTFFGTILYSPYSLIDGYTVLLGPDLSSRSAKIEEDCRGFLLFRFQEKITEVPAPCHLKVWPA